MEPTHRLSNSPEASQSTASRRHGFSDNMLKVNTSTRVVDEKAQFREGGRGGEIRVAVAGIGGIVAGGVGQHLSNPVAAKFAFFNWNLGFS